MTIFNPIDVMGPAHRGAQVAQLAQTAGAGGLSPFQKASQGQPV